MNNRIETFLNDMSFNSSITFLEEGKNTDELKEIAEKRGIKLPAEDIAPFKCVYAFVDRMNKNNCTLPRAEVERAIGTLIGKAVDFDHFRKRVVGHWIDAKLVGDEIIAYGVFFKGNFGEDYEVIKDLMRNGVLAISFEAWGQRDVKKDGSYDLRDIEFAGGALLIKTEPAFPGSEVLELAKQEKILEFAKVMTAPEHFIHSESEKENLEEARYFISDIESIMRAIHEVDCTSCGEKGFVDVLSIDFAKDDIKLKCLNCEAELAIQVTPKATISKKGRKIKKITETVCKSSIDNVDEFIESFEGSDEKLGILFEESPKLTYKDRLDITDDNFALVKSCKLKSGQTKKIRMFPIHDPAHVRNAMVKLEDELVQATLGKLGVSIDSVKRKITRRTRKINMKKLMEKYEKSSVEDVIQVIAKATINRELTKEELELAYTLVDLKGTNPSANATSLLTLKGKSTSNPTSLVSASITEEAMVDIIKTITNAPVETPAKVEEVAVKETSPVKAQEETEKEDIDENETPEEARAKLEAQLGEALAELAQANEKLAVIEKAERDAKIAKRKEQLGTYAKDMTDDQILDEKDFMIAMLTKERDEAKAKVEPKVEKSAVKDLAIGGMDKDVATREAEARKKVDKYAFGAEVVEQD